MKACRSLFRHNSSNSEILKSEDMLRAIIARGSNEDQRLMSQAQEASRDLRPIREEMSTSSRVLRNGMVNLAVDIERKSKISSKAGRFSGRTQSGESGF